MIFRHEFIQLIHLRENGFDVVNYLKRSKRYVPDVVENHCKSCGLKLQDEKCFICDSDLMKVVKREIEGV